ncbi:Biopolymer transport protein ExbD/TolR [Roseimaritima multifibrata]|uniref:Biopolymer transport protein ExbD/TolR n=1 Tax=Roseimaritima multifibrata TaxID=1930274 RepID=A0A517MK34_9BACT|nr:biopolymer transporter ExbD [Roseimaritima multifibrata]QDS95238.1 Biopolymer transport protein ExbD/TolR [Roseimaritima multifibrata]
MKIRNQQDPAKNELSMTSMIDVVFLLLIFFILTFKVVEQEGDFGINMPLAGQASSAMEDLELPITLRMHADPDGNLTSMELNELPMGTSFENLRAKVTELVGNQPGPSDDDEDGGPEVEIDTDFNLRYEYVIAAITHVSGRKDGDQIIKLVEKIKFAAPRR